MSMLNRRGFVKLSGAAALVGLSATTMSRKGFAAAKGHVVVIGGGYGGSIAAKYIRMADPGIDVTLVEKNEFYYSGPLSNWVIAGFRDIEVQKWGYEGLKKHGVKIVHDEATGIDPAAKTVTTKGGTKIKYDRLIVSPGISFKPVEGYDAEAMEKMPHAWSAAGPQTVTLNKQLTAMRDGDPFVMVAPPDPYRCPPGPYERASLVAHYLMKNKPKSKVIILDPKDKFSKMGLFTGGWTKLYGYGTDKSLIELVPGGEGGKVARVDAKTMTVHTEMAEFKSSCINVIPPQKAGAIAEMAKLTDESGWCPVHLETFESKIHKDIHVIGDSSVASPLPKSGYAANSEAKVAAAAIVALLNGQKPGEPSYVNTCYSLLSPTSGISVAAVYKLVEGKIKEVGGGLTAADASDSVRAQEAVYNESWYQSIMADTFS